MKRSLIAFVLLASAAVTSVAAQTQAALQVGATVTPRCRIAVGDRTGARGPVVTASCGTGGLRVLRVTTSRGDELRPINQRTLRAGGERMFVIPVTSSGASRDGRSIVVTLDF